jgi:glycosyltransferase involved in cell wall biosynthesis
MPSPALILYSPLPPADTGTANYLVSVLGALRGHFGAAFMKSVVVAVDSSAGAEQFAWAAKFDCSVLDFRAVERNASSCCVYFLASNPYHSYCYEGLASHRLGRCVSLIHDLTAAFFVRDLARAPGSAYAELNDLAFSDLAPRRRAILDGYDHLHEITRTFITGQGVAFEKSDVILTHSYYAKARLLLDFGASQTNGDRIRVCAMPAPFLASFPATPSQAPPGKPEFIIGSHGYFARNKRLDVVIRSWLRFLERHDGAAAKKLLIGGRFPQSEIDALMAECPDRWRGAISFPGYLSNEDPRRHIADGALLISLRFPSCGETSGMLAIARALDAPVAVSDFAAFREEPAAFRISTDPLLEVDQLTDAIEQCYQAWRDSRRIENRPPAEAYPKAELAPILGALAAMAP